MARKRARKAPQRRPLFVRQAEANRQLEKVLAETAATDFLGAHGNFLLGYVWSRVPGRVRSGACSALRAKADRERQFSAGAEAVT